MRRWHALLPLLLLGCIVWLIVRSTGSGGDTSPVDRRADPIDAPAGADAALRGREAPPSPSQATPAADVPETIEWSFSGRVVAAGDGRPLPGVAVLVFHGDGPYFNERHMKRVAEATTDPEGRFAFTGTWPYRDRGVDSYVEFRAPGRRVLRRWVLSPSSTELDIRLEAGGRVSGQVVRSGGGSLSDTWAWVVGEGRRTALDAMRHLGIPGPVRVDETGEFRVDHVALEQRLLVRVETGDGATGASPVFRLSKDEPAREGLVVPVEAHGGIRGRVSDAAGVLLAEGVLRLEVADLALSRGEDAFRPYDLTDGTFTFPRVPPGLYHVWLSHPAFAYATLTPTPIRVEAGEVTDLGAITLESGLEVSGRIIVPEEDGEMDVFDGIYVVIENDEQSRSGWTDETGVFRVRGLRAGTYGVYVDDPCWRQLEPLVVEAGTTGLAIDVVGCSADLAIEFLGEAAQAIDEFRVWLLAPGERGARLHQESELSREFNRVTYNPPGRYDVMVEAAGMALWTLDGVTLAAKQVRTLAVCLQPAPRLARRVVDAAGSPVAWAQVVLTTCSRWPLGPVGPDVGGETRHEARTDGEGRFDVPVSHRDLVLTVLAKGYAGCRTRLADGDPPDPIVLAKGHRVAGRLVDGRGSGVAGIFLQLRPGGAPRAFLRQNTVTEANGAFAFDHVGAGAWVLDVFSFDDRIVGKHAIDVGPDATDLGNVLAPGR